MWLHTLVKINGSDKDDIPWLQALASGKLDEQQVYTSIKQQEPKPLKQLPPAATLIAWLILSHHRFPVPHDKKKWRDEPAPDMAAITRRIQQDWGYENRQDEQQYNKRLQACFERPDGFLSQSLLWIGQLKNWAQHLHAGLPHLQQSMQDGSYRCMMKRLKFHCCDILRLFLCHSAERKSVFMDGH